RRDPQESGRPRRQSKYVPRNRCSCGWRRRELSIEGGLRPPQIADGWVPCGDRTRTPSVGQRRRFFFRGGGGGGFADGASSGVGVGGGGQKRRTTPCCPMGQTLVEIQ